MIAQYFGGYFTNQRHSRINNGSRSNRRRHRHSNSRQGQNNNGSNNGSNVSTPVNGVNNVNNDVNNNDNQYFQIINDAMPSISNVFNNMLTNNE